MGVNEFAAKAVRKIGKMSSKKLTRKGVKAAPLPRPEPTVIKGDKYFCGYAVREVMPDDKNKKKEDLVIDKLLYNIAKPNEKIFFCACGRCRRPPNIVCTVTQPSWS